MERLTEKHWRNLDPWECCGQDYYCKRGCHDEGGCTKGCIVPKLYVRLARYEDIGLEPKEVEAVKAALMGREIAQITEFDGIPIARLQELAKSEKDNPPLTLEELREMDGPVWICYPQETWGPHSMKSVRLDCTRCMFRFEEYGKTWLAYRRKPEEGTM